MAEARPPYVMFETRAVEDRTKSDKKGAYAFKDVHYAIITPSGSTDRIEKIATEWLDGLEEAVRQERFPQVWLEGYRQKYKMWLETNEVPEDGTPILGWPAISPAQAKMILNANIRTLEDLAAANESALGMIGIGARSLRDKAQAWLDTAEDTGKSAQELDTLRKRVTELETAAVNDQAKIAELQTKIQLLEKEDA